MPKLNPVTIFGGVLVLIGLTGPWFTFHLVDHSVGNYCRFKMSPFTLTMKASKVNDPFNEVISSGYHHFYGADKSLIGIACIIGAILSFCGSTIDRWRLSLVGGVMTLLSTLSFSMCLPKYLPGLSVGWGLTASALGAILILSSLGLGFLRNIFRSIISFAFQEMNIRLNALFSRARPRRDLSDGILLSAVNVCSRTMVFRLKTPQF